MSVRMDREVQSYLGIYGRDLPFLPQTTSLFVSKNGKFKRCRDRHAIRVVLIGSYDSENSVWLNFQKICFFVNWNQSGISIS